MDAVMLRSKFPESSLSELSENSEEVTGKYISKSGLSHCFKDIEKLYNEVKEKRGEKGKVIYSFYPLLIFPKNEN